MLLQFILIASGAIACWHLDLIWDEAYYWSFSQDLAMGYFDHPPMVAWLIAPGYALFQDEFGVRMITFLMWVAGLYIMRSLVRRASGSVSLARVDLSFWLLIGGVTMLVLGAGVAAPDSPLLFFTMLFMVILRALELRRDSLWLWLALALTVAAMFYSKYHAILPLVAALVSFRWWYSCRWFYLAVLLCTLLMLPHLFWQIDHGFPSLAYHLRDRHGGGEPMINRFLDLFGGQLLVLGPLISIPMVVTLFRASPEDAWERFMKRSGVITLVFLFAITFMGRVEANWSSVAIPSLLYFMVRYLSREPRFWLMALCRAGFVVVVSFRLLSMSTHWMDEAPLVGETKGQRKWVQDLAKKAGCRSVMFYNSYKRASMYRFYHPCGEAWSFNTPQGRANQYDIWEEELNHQCDSILVVANWMVKGWDSVFLHRNDPATCSWSYPFQALAGKVLKPDSAKYEVYKGEPLELTLDGLVDYSTPCWSEGILPAVAYVREDGHYEEYQGRLLEVQGQGPVRLRVTTPVKPGNYKAYLSLTDHWHLVSGRAHPFMVWVSPRD